MTFLRFVSRHQTDDPDMLAFREWIAGIPVSSETDVSRLVAILHHYKAPQQVVRGFKTYKAEYEKTDWILVLKTLHTSSIIVWAGAFLNMSVSAITGYPFYPTAANLTLTILGLILFGFSLIISSRTRMIREYPSDHYEGVPLTPFFKNTPPYLIAPIFVSLVVLALTMIFSEYEVFSWSINTLLLCSIAILISKKVQDWI